jgi:excisionase family DNA binding protein
MSTENDWLNLGEAAEVLGVHPATVRAWSDRGELPTQRTAGGHRRFRRADLETWGATAGKIQERRQLTSAQLVVQNMLGRARLELTEGAFNDESWYQLLDEQAKKELREIGRRLLHLVVAYLTEPAQEAKLLQQAQQIGRDYQALGQQQGLSLVETTRAYLHFREFLSQTIYDMLEAAGTQGPTDWGELRRRIILLTNDILLALIDAYEQQL